MSNKTRKKQIENQAQQGRSMVEMLGVLAVIGVISIGGISGYRMAMNRYQANQIANEINLMRTDAKMKVARGVELLLGEPYDGEDGHLNFNANYGVEIAYPVIISDEEGEEGGEKGYSFTLSGIPAGVCQPLATLLDGMDDTAALEINGKDYETVENLCDNEENELVVAFSTKDLGGIKVCNPEKCPGECTENGECKCPEGSHLSGDECVTCSDEAPWNGSECACPEANEYWNGNVCVGCKGGTWDNGAKTCTCTNEEQTWNVATGECTCSSENQHWDGSGCIACGSNEVWNEVDGQCEVPEAECRTNADCNKNGKSGYFCYTSTSKDCYIEFDENTHNSGKCKLVSSYLEKKAKIGGTTYYGTTSGMTWWSACRFCAARKGEDDAICKSGTSGTTGTTAEPDFMAGYEMLQCADKIDVDSQKVGWCHESEAGNTSRANDNISEKVKDLREMYCGSGKREDSCSHYPWLRDSYSSCYAYHVYLTNGYVTMHSHFYNCSALCE